MLSVIPVIDTAMQTDDYFPNVHRDQVRSNAYPSSNDWSAADEMVATIDGNVGADPNVFALYVTGCDGVTRAFPYSQKDDFIAAAQRGDQPPAGIQPVDCPAV
jgi:hypothetical protein